MNLSHALSLLFCATLLQGLLIRVGLPVHAARMAPEIGMLLVVMSMVPHRAAGRVPGAGCVIGYVVLTLVAGLVARQTPYDSYLYCRYVVYAFLVLCAVWTTPLSRADVNRVHAVLLLLAGLQIVASLHEVFILRGRWEQFVGTVSADGGGIGTTLPLLAMGYTLALYLCYRRRAALLVLTFAFLIVGYASHKRGIWFLMPPLLLAEYAIHRWNEGRWFSPRTLWGGAVLLALIGPLVLFGVRNTVRLHGETASSPLEELAYAWEYGRTYDTDVRDGVSAGRTSTNQRVFRFLRESFLGQALLGFGPRAVMGTGGGFAPLEIGYGIAGWSRDVISVGVPAMALYVLLYAMLGRRILRAYRRVAVPYWRALALGTLVGYLVFVMDHFHYGASFSSGGALAFPLAYFTGLLLSPLHARLRASDPRARRSPAAAPGRVVGAGPPRGAGRPCLGRQPS